MALDLEILPAYNIKEQPYGGNTAFVSVPQKALLIANVADIFLSLIAISVGSHPETVGITPLIDLNGKGGVKLPYKNDFTIGKDGVLYAKKAAE